MVWPLPIGGKKVKKVRSKEKKIFAEARVCRVGEGNKTQSNKVTGPSASKRGNEAIEGIGAILEQVLVG